MQSVKDSRQVPFEEELPIPASKTRRYVACPDAKHRKLAIIAGEKLPSSSFCLDSWTFLSEQTDEGEDLSKYTTTCDVRIKGEAFIERFKVGIWNMDSVHDEKRRWLLEAE